jgi:hypothetical protein
MSTTKAGSKRLPSARSGDSRAAATPASRQARLLQLGALAVSAGLTAAQLKRLAEARRLRALAGAMHEESAAITAWVANGARPDEAPTPSKALDAWQAGFAEADLVKA